MYIANEEGKNAVLEINMPAANNWKAKHILPTCTPNSRHTALKINYIFTHICNLKHVEYLTYRSTPPQMNIIILTSTSQNKISIMD